MSEREGPEWCVLVTVPDADAEMKERLFKALADAAVAVCPVADVSGFPASDWERAMDRVCGG